MEKTDIEEPPQKKRKSEGNFEANNEILENGSVLKRVKVGSRKSQLALFQSNFVVDLLRKNYSNISYDIVPMSTTGDKILDVALSKIGEKSLFTKELEVALEKDEIHFIVHSLKDLPTSLPPGMVIGAICKRENPFDVVVFSESSTYKDLKELPNGSVIGTSSLRRIAQLKKLYPSLTFESVRGNLNTRLRKLDDDNKYSALILAAAGVIRLDLEHRIGKILTPSECMYAVGQGALAIECKADDLPTIHLLSKISDKDTTLCCIAERAFMKKLEGGCSVPVAVYSRILNEKLYLKGGVFSLDGSKCIIEELSTDFKVKSKQDIKQQHYAGIVAPHIPHSLLHISNQLGEALAELLLEKGAAAILQEVRTNS
ncbi:porphobilinogen deaminase-like [Uloborus diversus]|uniref:porphobilinogen deaminase-like n=1 Tax=Uloborus diversus TaxID=327109 RepID=UPI002409A674|nr:porphobilinogen deaminase-like [Uloborus diversus]